jgi:adenosylcobyric acid synthase
LHIGTNPDGAVSANGRIEGSYLHGLFASDCFRHAWLASLRAGHKSNMNFDGQVDNALDDIARELERALDATALLALAERPGWSPQI